MFVMFRSILRQFVASLCSQKSVNELMSLWFEIASQFDVPDPNFSSPMVSFVSDTAEPDHCEDVKHSLAVFHFFLLIYLDLIHTLCSLQDRELPFYPRLRHPQNLNTVHCLLEFPITYLKLF